MTLLVSIVSTDAPRRSFVMANWWRPLELFRLFKHLGSRVFLASYRILRADSGITLSDVDHVAINQDSASIL
jgi:hypothetical protein